MCGGRYLEVQPGGQARRRSKEHAIGHRGFSLGVCRLDLTTKSLCVSRIAEDEAERQKSHRLTELQNKTVIMVSPSARQLIMASARPVD